MRSSMKSKMFLVVGIALVQIHHAFGMKLRRSDDNGSQSLAHLPRNLARVVSPVTKPERLRSEERTRLSQELCDMADLDDSGGVDGFEFQQACQFKKKLTNET